MKHRTIVITCHLFYHVIFTKLNTSQQPGQHGKVSMEFNLKRRTPNYCFWNETIRFHVQKHSESKRQQHNSDKENFLKTNPVYYNFMTVRFLIGAIRCLNSTRACKNFQKDISEFTLFSINCSELFKTNTPWRSSVLFRDLGIYQTMHNKTFSILLTALWRRLTLRAGDFTNTDIQLSQYCIFNDKNGVLFNNELHGIADNEPIIKPIFFFFRW